MTWDQANKYCYLVSESQDDEYLLLLLWQLFLLFLLPPLESGPKCTIEILSLLLSHSNGTCVADRDVSQADKVLVSCQTSHVSESQTASLMFGLKELL